MGVTCEGLGVDEWIMDCENVANAAKLLLFSLSVKQGERKD